MKSRKNKLYLLALSPIRFTVFHYCL